MEKLVKNNEKIRLIIVAFLCVLLCFLILLNKYTPVFLRIDDVKMRWIISGAYTGNPSAYALYLKYPFSYIIKMLYVLFPNNYWYSISFIAIHAICLFMVLFKILEQFGKRKMRNYIVIIISVVLVFLFFNIDNILNLEFTSLAAVCGSTGLFLLIIEKEDNSIKNNLFNICCYIFLFVLCYGIRLSVFKMVSVFIMTVMIFSKSNIKYIQNNWKKTINLFWISNKKMIISIILILFTVGATKISNIIAYSSDDWKEFQSYNSKRSLLYDYEDMIPDYYENMDFYQNLEIDENSYLAITDYNIGFPEEISIETINSISEYSKKTKIRGSIEEAFYVVYEVLFDEDFAFITIILMFFSFINVCLFFLSNQKNHFRAYLICIIGILFECFYMGIGGRFPERVVISILLIWNAVNWGYLINNLKFYNHNTYDYKKIITSNKIISGLFFIILIFLLLFILSIKYTKLTYKIDEASAKLSNILPIKEYVNTNKENFYYMTTHLISRKYSEMWNEEPIYCNFQELGGWEMFSPCFEEKMNKEEFKSIESALLKEKVYLITDEQYAIDYILTYYNNKYGGSVISEIEDVIPGNNCDFYVISFRNN